MKWLEVGVGMEKKSEGIRGHRGRSMFFFYVNLCSLRPLSSRDLLRNIFQCP